MPTYRAVAPGGTVIEREDVRIDAKFAKLVRTNGKWTIYSLRDTVEELNQDKAFIKGNRKFCIVEVERVEA